MELSRSDTTAIKGIAILLMLWHHLFLNTMADSRNDIRCEVFGVDFCGVGCHMFSERYADRCIGKVVPLR